MQSESTILRTLACALFSLGLILVSSGWAPALSRMMSHRPVWSVCGQSLCDCRPVEMPADCPLCALGLTGESQCSDTEPRVDPGRVALRRSGGELVMMHLGSAAESLLAGLFLLGLGVMPEPAALNAGVRPTLSGWTLPSTGSIDIPTPPPRA